LYLLRCRSCKDIVSINDRQRRCKCSMSYAKIDSRCVVMYSGPCDIIRMRDTDLENPLTYQIRPWYKVDDGASVERVSHRKRQRSNPTIEVDDDIDSHHHEIHSGLIEDIDELPSIDDA